MNWKQLVTTLGRCVPAGSVAPCAHVSLWGYGLPNYNQPVRSLLRGAGNHGHQELTNHMVGTDGRLADFPEGYDQQERRLLAEGVPFTADGRVDFDRVSPVDIV